MTAGSSIAFNHFDDNFRPFSSSSAETDGGSGHGNSGWQQLST